MAEQTSEALSRTKTEMLFGEFLVNKGLITRRELTEVLNEQRDRQGRLGEVLIRLKALSSEQVTEALAEFSVRSKSPTISPSGDWFPFIGV